MAVSDYGAVQSTVIQGVSNAIRDVKGFNSLIAPNQWASNISELNSDADYNHIVSQMIEETATGSIASFTDGANNIPTKEIICHINPTETGTGEKSPQNPYVIGGFLETNITQQSTIPVTNNAPYLFRQSGGDNNAYVGTEETDKLVGASAVVNQLVQNGNFADTSVWVTYHSSKSVANNELTETVTSGNDNGTIYQDIPVVVGHKYFVTAYAKVGTAERVRITYNNAISGWTEVTSATYTSTNKVGQATTSSLRVALSVYGDGLTGMCKDFNVFDLTAMFGTAIADYVYSLEQGTAGSGKAYLRKYGFFTKDYIPYTANALQSVKTSAHIMRDAQDAIIGNYALPNIDLRGLYKLDASNNLYADGDTLTGDGTLTRKYAIIPLSDFTWTIQSSRTNVFQATTNLPSDWKLSPSNSQIMSAISNKYVASNYNTTMSTTDTSDKIMCYRSITAGKGIIVKDNSLASLWNDFDLTAFRQALEGAYVIYEKDEPTTEQATGFTNPQIVSKYGTEEYVDNRTFPLPVGHETVYLPTERMDYSISFGQTVYGGTLNVTTGVLTIEFNYFRVTQVTGIMDAYGARINLLTVGQPLAAGYSLATNPFKCNIFKSSNYSESNNNHIHFVNAQAFAIRSVEEIGTELSDWSAWLNDHPCYLCYKRQTPRTIQLTPTEVKTLLGTNNIYHDCNGDIDVTYRANGALYVEQH